MNSFAVARSSPSFSSSRSFSSPKSARCSVRSRANKCVQLDHLHQQRDWGRRRRGGRTQSSWTITITTTQTQTTTARNRTRDVLLLRSLVLRAKQNVSCATDGSASDFEDQKMLERMKLAVRVQRRSPTARHVIETLKELSEQEFGLSNVKFVEVMQKIDEMYRHDAKVGYTSGFGVEDERMVVRNDPGTNSGSCKLFYFARMNEFGEEATLRLFCEHYRDVLNTPEGTSHSNIRSFMRNGWNGIVFDGEVLLPRGSSSEDEEEERVDQI